MKRKVFMLKQDGKYQIYIIQHQYNKEGNWCNSDIDTFEPNSLKRWKDGKELEPWCHLSANGTCWQETGIHGTFDIDDARKMILLLKKHNEQHNFRVVRVDIWQDSFVVWSI